MKIILSIILSLFLTTNAFAIDKLITTTLPPFLIGIFDTSTNSNGIAGLDVNATGGYDNYQVKVQCGNNTTVTMDEAGDTIVDQSNGYYYVTMNDTFTVGVNYNFENECKAWVVGTDALLPNGISLIAYSPFKFKAIGATMDAVTLADNAITATKIAAGAIGSSESGEYTFTVVSSGDCTNSAVLFDTNLTQTLTDHWRDSFATFTTGALAGQTKAITAYNGTTKCMTVKSPGFSTTPTAGDTGIIINK